MCTPWTFVECRLHEHRNTRRRLSTHSHAYTHTWLRIVPQPLISVRLKRPRHVGPMHVLRLIHPPYLHPRPVPASCCPAVRMAWRPGKRRDYSVRRAALGADMPAAVPEYAWLPCLAYPWPSPPALVRLLLCCASTMTLRRKFDACQTVDGVCERVVAHEDGQVKSKTACTFACLLRGIDRRNRDGEGSRQDEGARDFRVCAHQEERVGGMRLTSAGCGLGGRYQRHA